MPEIVAVVCLLVGLALGGAAGWLLMRGRAAHAAAQARAEAGSQIVGLTERLVARDATLDETRATLRERDQSLSESRSECAAAERKATALSTTLDEERKQTREKLVLLDDAQRKLTDAFKALSAEALRSNNQSFLELAKTNLEKYHEVAKGDLDKRQLAITELVKPVRDSLEKVDAKIQEIEKTREGAYQGLTAQVKSLFETQKALHGETANLVRALRAPVVRGRWGEIQLRRVVEIAGMIDHCDFYEQQTTEDDGTRLRPDMLVRLPGGKSIVVDAKTPLAAYLDAVEATDDETRRTLLANHARQVRQHVSDLSKKSYFEQFADTPEFAVLFLPGESFYSSALEHDPQLIEIGAEQRVIIATPTTLIALLRAVYYGWRQQRLADNARAISELGAELYKRVADMAGHLARLGKNLGAATKAYNDTIGSLETRVLVTTRRFRDLGAASSTEIDPLLPIETATRALQSPELCADDDSVILPLSPAKRLDEGHPTLEGPGAVQKKPLPAADASGGQ